MSDNVNLSKKIVTYEAMSKYDECLKQFINNKLANFDGGSSDGSSNTNNALPIGNLDDGIHTWENLMTAVYEKSFGGPIQIHNPNWMSVDGKRQYIIYSGIYLGVCDSQEYHGNTGGTLGPESATGYNNNTFNLPTTSTTTSSSTTTTTTSAASEPSTTTTTTSAENLGSTTSEELESTTSTSEVYHGPNLVLMIGNVLTFELSGTGGYHTPVHGNSIHTTDYHIVGLSIENDNDAGYNDLNYYDINVLFDIPIVSLSKLSGLESKINNLSLSFKENIPDGINSNGFINLGHASEYDVDPNSSIVIRPKDEEGNNPIIYLNYPKIGQVNEYTIIINNDGTDHVETESGVLPGNIVLTMAGNNDRDLIDNERFRWSTPPLYAFNGSDKTYELNIKVVPYKEVFDEDYNRNTLLQYDAYVTWTEYTN